MKQDENSILDAAKASLIMSTACAIGFLVYVDSGHSAIVSGPFKVLSPLVKSLYDTTALYRHGILYSAIILMALGVAWVSFDCVQASPT